MTNAPFSIGPLLASPRARTLGAYALAALLSLVAAVPLLELWQARLRVPFDYNGDSLSFAMVAKAVVDHGWYLNNPQLGAPFGQQMHDFPFADSLHLLIIKLLSV